MDKYPREYLLAELKRVAKICGKIPSMADFDKHSNLASVTLAKRFKGWKGALESAGFDPAKTKFTYQDIELIEEIKKVALLLGKTPSTEEFDKNSSMHTSTIIHRFKSWRAACEIAGLKPYVSSKPPHVPAGWNKGLRKLKIDKDKLKYMYETERLSVAAIAVRLGVSRNTVQRKMEELGIEVRKLNYTMPRETSIEAKLYEELERRGITYTKQQVIDGLWVADALIPGARIVIEADGAYWHKLPDMEKRDRKKDAYLKAKGYQVFRFPEEAIKADVQGCVQKIVDALINRYQKK